MRSLGASKQSQIKGVFSLFLQDSWLNQMQVVAALLARCITTSSPRTSLTSLTSAKHSQLCIWKVTLSITLKYAPLLGPLLPTTWTTRSHPHRPPETTLDWQILALPFGSCWPQASRLTSLCLSFWLCKLEMKNTHLTQSLSRFHAQVRGQHLQQCPAPCNYCCHFLIKASGPFSVLIVSNCFHSRQGILLPDLPRLAKSRASRPSLPAPFPLPPAV